ncbi:MAG: HAMP domain-containing histidine kinase [Oscillospiraceae bacterium]|nr:HAMP domain-containing histidine kinase [Oscillospiraceae bacterium]
MFGIKRTLDRLDKMLEDGINGTFKESDYNETRLSKLESKWLRYLTTSKLSAQKTDEERKKLKELVSDISHQTKTPLSNILLYTQILEEQPLDEQSRMCVNEIRSQSEKLEFLIKSLVKTSRLESGTFQISASDNNTDDLVRRVIGQVGPSAKAKNIKIEYTSENATACFDIKWTAEALFNIADNAVKYCPENSMVKISAEPYEMFVCITVADNGPGIPEDEQHLIFGRFYRGKAVREQNGVGIGLYLSRQIIESQGGYITVSSSEGKGTEFKVFLRKH